MGEKIHHHHHYPSHYDYNNNNNNELRSKSAGISGTTTWGGGGYGGINRLAPLGSGSNLMNHHGIPNIGGGGGGEGGGSEEHLSRSSSMDSGRLLGALPRFVHSAPAVARSLNLPPLQAFHGTLSQTHIPSHGHGQYRGEEGKGNDGGYHHQNLSGSGSTHTTSHHNGNINGPPPFSVVQFSRSQSDFSDIRTTSTTSNDHHQSSPFSMSSTVVRHS